MSDREPMEPAYFRAMYGASDDPWGFTSRWYEERKRALTMAALPRPRYRTALEVGSSIGVLSALLADRCDRLLCLELDGRAVELARERLASSDGIVIEQRDFFADPPSDSYDLIVYSEVLYYATHEQLSQTLDWTTEHLRAGGALVAVHWRADVAEYPQTARDVHTALRGALHESARYLDEDLELGLFTHPGTPSVAAAEGLS
ncbi:class I SAM-dependent DNA methyltransferase [Gordonia soli]|uniref:Putative methyltransferase n=1 Tax=Gordonia soli NBRC 108243 TaxID=1223545 RepID=M0QIR3_9ACTN|nr:SAM-dependent methyltransferase [Gordonia soli]GAC67322.1 putative methyltransferase [Gordonia soli NBRC 108243]